MRVIKFLLTAEKSIRKKKTELNICVNLNLFDAFQLAEPIFHVKN